MEATPICVCRIRPFVLVSAALISGVFAMFLTACGKPTPPPTGVVAAAGVPTFNAKVQPILSENCYHCHGPDGSSRKGGLRLDLPEFALKGGDSGKPAIVPGDAESSYVIQRILSKDPIEVMPPPAMHNQLDADEVEVLRQWINHGAAYEPHWAFVAPRRPALPAVQNSAWVRNPVDRFILARLEAESLTPVAAAEPSALLRRVTYDLTGLPPSEAEIEAFLSDKSSDAYEKVVERLLSSPRYGEHRARYWLDVARYGDSHGLHGDYERSVWPYRDYAIRAFNQNLPFDQFTRENLAGDMLPASSLDQLLASAFIRLGISSGEGGSIIQELRVNNQRERVEAFGATYMGLTTGCAACHDHKFDPLSQKDHFALTAFFNNLTENPNNQGRLEWPPFITLPPPERRAEYDKLMAQRADIVRRIQERQSNSGELIAKWLASKQRVPEAVSSAGLELRLRLKEINGAEFVNEGDRALVPSVVATGSTPVWGEDTLNWPSMRMETTTRIEIPSVGNVGLEQPFAVGGWVRPRYETSRFSKPPELGVLISRLQGKDDAARGWELAFVGQREGEDAKGGRVRFRLAASGGEAVIETVTAFLASERWTHLFATYDGSGSARGMRIYVDGRLHEARNLLDNLSGDMTTPAPFQLGRRSPDDAVLRETAFQDVRFYRRGFAEEEAVRVAYEDYVSEVAAKPAPTWSEDERHAIESFFFGQRDDVSLALAAQTLPIDAELGRISAGGPVALVSEEARGLAYADVLDRGVYSQRKERVRPAVPHFLPQLSAGSPKDRRGLAEWVVSADNPLTARVTVNRMWAELFGTGIVETTEDFGIMGARPVHPELLDWLAVEFRESGWNVKEFYRLMVTSATYRQSAKIEASALEKDPHNRLLSRGPRFRMDAEMLRDSVLATSGLLVEKQGGPSVKPYQPDGIWEAGTPPTSNTSKYVRDTGDALYRRSLYTFWKRMATMPNMNVFDAPDRDASCTRRQRTTTPLQALVTLNDVQWLEAARVLGEQLVRDYPTDEERLTALALRTLARPWSAEEKAILIELLGKFRDAYLNDAASAEQLVNIGEASRDQSISASAVATWMLMASTAQNLDATLNK